MSRRLWPNIDEHDTDRSRSARRDELGFVPSLWGGLFDRSTRWLAPDFAPDEGTTTGLHEEPAFEPLCETKGIVPWRATNAAKRVAMKARGSLWAPPTEVVRRLRDYAFAIHHSLEAGFTPPLLRDTIAVYDPGRLAGDRHMPAFFAQDIGDRIRDWPDELLRGYYELKPRNEPNGGGSRLDRVIPMDPRWIEESAVEFARTGGVVLEPSLDRLVDLSVVGWLSKAKQAHVAPPLTLLASLRRVGPGSWYGSLGEVDGRGRIFSNTPHDYAMQEAAVSIAHASRLEGYWGPCSVDGYAYQAPRKRDAPIKPDPPAVLRPISEFHARFTLGHVSAGWVRRAVPWLVSERGLSPEQRMGFLFALKAPAGTHGWREAAASSDAVVLPLPFATPLDPSGQPIDLASIDPRDHEPENHGPALVFDEDFDALDLLTARMS